MNEQDRLVSASEAIAILGERFGLPINHSKMNRLMVSGEIPSEKGTLDARKRLAKLSDVLKWGERAQKEKGRAA